VSQAKQNKIEFLKQMRSVTMALSNLKVTPEEMGVILMAGAIPVRSALVQEWAKVDKTRLAGELSIRPIIKQGKKRPDIVYIGPDWSGEKDYVWNMLQWGTVRRSTKGLRKVTRGVNKGQMIGSGKPKNVGVLPAYRFMDKAMSASKNAFMKACIVEFNKIVKKKFK